MGDQYKLASDGTCSSCSVVSVPGENLQCFMCKAMFHGACQSMSEDDKVAAKSSITAFLRPSTKGNFKFFCDVCLTKFEMDMANCEAKRIETVENNITSIRGELAEIKKLLKDSRSKPVETNAKKDNIWFDKERLASTKVAPAKPLLVVNNIQESSNGSIEKVIVDNGIPVTNSYRNNAGALVLECDNPDSREKLRTAIASSTETVQMKSISGKKPSVTIVGLSQQYSKEEVINQIVSQNQFVKHFSTVNDIKEHIEIHDIKPTKGNPSVFQAFASVSESLRKGFANYKDKVTVGLTNCKVYDRYHVKRCNNCQGLGHFYKDCPTPTEPCCGKCGLGHATNSCDASERKCTNCEKEGGVDLNHATFDPKCPTLVKLIEKKKKSQETHLNLQR